MQAIILAAGYGNRMRPLTFSTHKTMLEIAGRSVIEWIVDALIEHGVTDITVVTGYRAADLQTHMSRAYPDLKIRYVHNERYAETNNIFSMALALEAIPIHSDVLLIESDLIFDPAVIGRLLASPHPNVALVDRYRTGMDGTVVTIDDQMIVTNVIPPHLQGTDFNFADKYKTLNIYRFSKEFCRSAFSRLLTYYARVIDDNCYYELILGIVIYMQREVVHAAVVNGEKWSEIDDPNDLNLARFVFEKSKRKEILDSSFGGYWNYDVLDFCFIRNVYFPSSAVLAELKNNLDKLVQNYGSMQRLLNRKLAYYLLCSEENLTVLNGLSQVFPTLRRYLSGDHVLLPSPSFGEYSKAFPGAMTYSDDVGVDIEQICERTEQSDVVVFVNPNNPTGSTLPTQWIYEFAMSRPEKTIVIDESFIEFSGYPSMVQLLEDGPLGNVLVLKSFSKSLGVPGLRLGHVYSLNRRFNALLREDVPIWNLNSVAENFLEVILKHRKEIHASFEQTVVDRDRFAARLAELPLVDQVYPSGGNFLLVLLRPGSTVVRNLADRLLTEHSIYVRDVSSRFRGQGSYLRVAVRWPEENERLVRSLRSIMGESDAWDESQVRTA